MFRLTAIFLLFSHALAQECVSWLPDSDIDINPINFQVGGMEDCCKVCYYTANCTAFTWSGYNGGTCWLKSITGPTVYAPNNIVGIINKTAVVPPEPSINHCMNQQNMDIPNNDLINIQNSKSMDCCNLCYVTQGCKAYTWSADNNGTCWLKSSTGPMTANNNMIAAVLTPATMNWKQSESYDSTNFFSKFDFYTEGDPTHGFVDYVNQTRAQQLNLIAVNSNGTIYMGADNTNKITNGRGRPSVRISSKAAYNGGLFILDLLHMPVGNGTWPAYWLVGPEWPNNGEADILEGIGGNTANAITLHTSDGCRMQTSYEQLFTGNFADGNTKGVPATDCFIQDWAQKSNQGCGIQAANGTYGDGFNAASGGVYAFEWEKNDFMRVWVFMRGNIPNDISQGTPNPSNWGKPTAFFLLGSNCPPIYFNNMNLVFDLTFCGDWAGNVYPGGMGACNDEVRNNPQDYVGAYWLINSIKVYQNGLTTCIADLGACTGGGDCCSGLCFNGKCQ